MPKMLTKIMQLLLCDAGRRKKKSNERDSRMGWPTNWDRQGGGSGEWEHTVVVPALHKALIAGRQQQHGPSRGSVDVTEFTRK